MTLPSGPNGANPFEMPVPHARVGRAEDKRGLMSILDVRRDPTVRHVGDTNIPNEQHRPGVIITGSCWGSRFVPGKVLICAGSLSAEAAIRAWLEVHGIRAAG
jgi:hypothetical protein